MNIRYLLLSALLALAGMTLLSQDALAASSNTQMFVARIKVASPTTPTTSTSTVNVNEVMDSYSNLNNDTSGTIAVDSATQTALVNNFNNLGFHSTTATRVDVFGQPGDGQTASAGSQNQNISLSAAQNVVYVYKDTSGNILFATVDQITPANPSTGSRSISTANSAQLSSGTAGTIAISGGSLSTVSQVKITFGSSSFSSSSNVSRVFATARGMTVDASSSGTKRATLSGGELLEVDLVVLDAGNTLLSTAKDATTGTADIISGSITLEMPLSVSALQAELGTTATGSDLETMVNAAFASGVIGIFTADTVSDFESGNTSRITLSTPTWSASTGLVTFTVNHFSVFAAGSNEITTNFGNGGCALDPLATTRDGAWILLLLTGLGFWLRSRKAAPAKG